MSSSRTPEDIARLSPEVDPQLRAELEQTLAAHRAGDAVGVVTRMYRLSMLFLDKLFETVGETRPNDNLFDGIARASRGDGKKIRGLGLLPPNHASYLQNLRSWSNPMDHADQSVPIPTVQDAANQLTLLLSTLEWFYCRYEGGARLSSLFVDLPPRFLKVELIEAVPGMSVSPAEKAWYRLLHLQGLRMGEWYKVGRESPDATAAGHITVNMDGLEVKKAQYLSRGHLEIQVGANEVEIRRARGKLYFQGKEVESFRLSDGDIFTAGIFRFRLHEGELLSELSVVAAVDEDYLRRSQPQPGLEALLELVPLLMRDSTPLEFLNGILAPLSRLLPEASLIIAYEVPKTQGHPLTILGLHGKLQGGLPQPSRTLVERAFSEDTLVYFRWDAASDCAHTHTHRENVRWAMAAPIQAGEHRYALYAVAAEGTPDPAHQTVLGLVAEIARLYLRSRAA